MREGKPERTGSLRRTLADFAASAWVLGCLMLGGASNAGVAGNACLQAMAVIIISWAVWRGYGRPLTRAERSLAVIFGLFASWVLITLLPLPPRLWSALPGRHDIVEGYKLLGMQLPWLPVSLAPDRTGRSALALLIPLATWLLMRRSGASGRARLLRLVVLFAGASAALGLAQLASGRASRLRPYEITNNDQLVGLFANANHFSMLMVALLPMIAASILAPAVSTSRKAPPSPWRGWQSAAVASAALCAIAVVMNGSKAGLLLAIPALAAFFILAPLFRSRGDKPRGGIVLGLVGAAIALTIVSGVGSGFMQGRIGSSAASRAEFASTTIAAARESSPVGAGMGTFPAIYAMKTKQLVSGSEWVNHAHNDWAELALELGVPGVIAAFAFLFWLLHQTIIVWRRVRWDGSTRSAAAATVALWLLIVHSLVDYPLRTAAIAAIAAMAATLVAREPDVSSGDSDG